MPLLLNQRKPHLIEEMDKTECDPVKLHNTYEQFYRINGLLSRWKVIYKKHLFPLMKDRSRSYTLLDIGFGGGDIDVSLSNWAAADGIDLKITAIEKDPRAMKFIRQRVTPETIQFRQTGSSELLGSGMKYDFVISNHVLHHLDDEAFQEVLSDAKQLARHKVIFNDIERSDLGYLLFTTFARPLFRNSFIVADGLTSIRKSYTQKELARKKPTGWELQRLFPFRLLLIYQDYARID